MTTSRGLPLSTLLSAQRVPQLTFPLPARRALILHITLTPGLTSTIRKGEHRHLPDSINHLYLLLLAPTFTRRHLQCRTSAIAYEQVGRLQTNPIHYFNWAELTCTKESSWNRKDGASTHRLRLPQIVSTYSVDSMNNLYLLLFATTTS